MKLFCDGLCEPNPNGYATWGWAAFNETGQEIASGKGCLGSGPGMSNNIAEYEAVLQALLWLWQKRALGAALFTDSQLVVKQVSGEWACRAAHLLPLVIRVRKGLKTCKSTLSWVPREENIRADALSMEAYHEARQTDGGNETTPFLDALRAIDEAHAEVTDWEAQFLQDMLRKQPARLSEKQQGVIVRMVERYLSDTDAATLRGQLSLLPEKNHA